MQLRQALPPSTRPAARRGRPCTGSRGAACVPRAQAQARLAPSPVEKDMSARLLQTALSVGLKNRLHAHQSIHVDVRCTAGGLMNGVFGGMVIRGTGWRTPLSLTADAVEVDVGELLLDYSALVSGSAVALRNLPTGSCTFRLTASDLANFLNHRLLQPIVSKAVQGKAFYWDTDSVTIGVDAATGRGCVEWDGRWEGDGNLYRVHMVPMPPSKPGGPSPLRVAAKRLNPDTPAPTAPAAAAAADAPAAAAAAAAAAVAAPAPAAGSVAPKAQPRPVPASQPGTVAVAQGIANMFSSLTLNLEGIELRSPCLTLMLPEHDPTLSEPLLEISMKMKIRGIPPLNMQF